MAHERFTALPCYKEMHDRILVASVPEVARWLQQEKKEFGDVKTDTLVRALSRYKTSIPAKEFEKVGERMLGSIAAKVEEAKGDLDELAVLAKLIRVQVARIERAKSQEDEARFNVHSNLHNDLLAAKKLIDSSASLKFKLGIYKESERSVTVNHNLTTAKHLDSLKPEEKRRAGVLASNVLGLLASVLSNPEAQDAAPEVLVDADEIVDAEDLPFELVSVEPARIDAPQPS